MSKSPLNYLVTIALGALLWVITAIFYNNTLSESLIMAESTPEDFQATLRIMLGGAAVIGISNCLYWYYYGNLDSTAGNLGGARRVWWVSFVLQVIASVSLLFTLVAIYMSEGVVAADWAIIYGLLSLHTWFFFWICTFIMSPRTVKYIPLFKK